MTTSPPSPPSPQPPEPPERKRPIAPAAKGERKPHEDRPNLDWALAAPEAATAAADWLAEDISPGCGGAIALVTAPQTPLEHLRQAKEAFKTMRLMAERPSDRRLAARLYAATIASALVHRGTLITAQRRSTVRRALEGLLDDGEHGASLRTLARAAIKRLGQ